MLSRPSLPFSIDPLIAEAKRRTRLRRLLLGSTVVLVAATAAVVTIEFRAQRVVAPVPANLTILVVGQSFPGHGTLSPESLYGGRALFHLKCDPASGDVADPAKACAAIAAQPSLVTDPKPYLPSQPDSGFSGFGTAAGGAVSNTPWYFRITGSVNGKAVQFAGSGLWSSQVPLIDKLGLAGPHGNPLRLQPRRHGFVAMNHTRTFAPGVLRPGDILACSVSHGYIGRPLAMSVPVRRGLGPWVTSAGPGLLAVRIRADGTVLGSCFARDRMPLSKRGRTMDPKNWPPKSLRS